MPDHYDARTDALAAAIEKLSLEVSEGLAEQAKYTGEAYVKLDSKIVQLDAKVDALDARMDAGFTRLDSKMDAGFARVDTNAARLEGRMDAGFARVDTNAARLEGKMDAGFTRLERKLDQFIDTQIQTNLIVDRRLRLLEE